MATKKTANKTNVMKLVWDGLTLVLGGLLLGLIALPHWALYVAGNMVDGANVSGYDLIDFGEGSDAGVAVVLLLLVVFASVLVLGAILKLLADLKVVKNSTFAKVANWVMLVSALAVAVLAIVNIITVSVYCGNNSTIIADKVSGAVASWGTLIVNGILGVGTVVTSMLSVRK
ncbi:MAG: hypothetical protein ACI4R8_00745 [Candidatus Caccovivens sp.]